MRPSSVSQKGNLMEESTYWLEKAPVMKAIRHMALPMILAMAVGTVYGFTDTLFIGWLGDTPSLAAVSLCLPYTAAVMALANLVGVGAATAISRRIGAHDEAAVRSISSFAFWAMLAIGIIAGACSLLFSERILDALGAVGDVRSATAAYLGVIAAAAPASILNFGLCQIVRSKADSKTAMYGMLGSSALNIVLDPVCIFALGMGVAGAALATALANIAAAAFYLVGIARSSEFSLRLGDARVSAAQLADILKIGAAAMLMTLFMAVSSLVFNTAAMGFGEEVVAGFGISQSIVQLLELVAMGLYEGVVPLIAAAYGAGNAARVREIVRKTSVCLAAFVAVAGIVLFSLRTQVISLFTGDAGVVAAAAAILTAQLGACAFASASGLITGIFQAEGKGVAANVASVTRGVALIPCVLVGGALFGIDGVIWALLAAEALSFSVCLATYALSRRTRNEAVLDGVSAA